VRLTSHGKNYHCFETQISLARTRLLTEARTLTELMMMMTIIFKRQLSGAVGKECQRRLLSRPRFVRSCSATDLFIYCILFLSNGEIADREWLICSPSEETVYSFVCKLFSHTNLQLTQKDSMTSNKKADRKSAMTHHSRLNVSGRADKQLVIQFLTATDHQPITQHFPRHMSGSSCLRHLT
jgi:hypothetical protein